MKFQKKTQQELIAVFKNAKFKRVADGSIAIDYDYRVNITLKAVYAIWVDSDEKLLSVMDIHEYYTIENDSEFLKILKNATE